MPAILDTAIGTVFIFLLFSLVVSALNEYILSLTDQRAKFLRMGLAEIFGQQAEKAGFFSPGLLKRVGKLISGGLICGGNAPLGEKGKEFLEHGLINAFSRSDSGTSPSYIPAGAFVAALLDIVVPQGAPVTNDTNQIRTVNDFLAALQSAKPADDKVDIFNTYDPVLGDFLKACEKLAQPPATGSLLGLLMDNAKDARARATAQKDLLAVVNFTAAQGIIDQPTNKLLKAELDELVKKAADDLGTFRDSMKNWFSLDTSRDTLEFNAISTMADLLRTTVEHTTAAIEAALNVLKTSDSTSKLGVSLLSLFRTVDGDVQKFKVAVEGWFNCAMDRVSGWYKRFSQKWMIALGFILAAALNVDTIEIVRVLSNNPNLARAVAEQAEAYYGENSRPLTALELAERRETNLQALTNAKDDLTALTDTNFKVAREGVSAAEKALSGLSEDDRKVETKLQDARKAVTKAQTALQEARNKIDPDVVRNAVKDAESAFNTLTEAKATLKALTEGGEKNEAKLKAATEVLQKAQKDFDLPDKSFAALKAANEALSKAQNKADTLKTYQSAVAKLQATGLPIGWTSEVKYKLGLKATDSEDKSINPANSQDKLEFNWLVLLAMIGGWGVTAIAASLGAPLWFDLLGRFINIRASGKAPGEKESTSNPTRPAPGSLDTTPGTR